MFLIRGRVGVSSLAINERSRGTVEDDEVGTTRL
jgi:hypothetical protein